MGSTGKDMQEGEGSMDMAEEEEDMGMGMEGEEEGDTGTGMAMTAGAGVGVEVEEGAGDGGTRSATLEVLPPFCFAQAAVSCVPRAELNTSLGSPTLSGDSER